MTLVGYGILLHFIVCKLFFQSRVPSFALLSTIHPSIHTSIHPSIHLSIHPSSHPSIHSFIHSFIHPFIRFQHVSSLRVRYTQSSVDPCMRFCCGSWQFSNAVSGCGLNQTGQVHANLCNYVSHGLFESEQSPVNTV